MEASGANILVVDDEPESIRLIGRLLAGDGYQVHVAESGERALQILDGLGAGTPLDLVLLDVLMPPGMNGIETCRRLKAREDARTVPVIFLTGKDDSETVLTAFAAGGADYVVKPVDADILLARVRAHAQLARLSRGLESLLAERTAELRAANAALQRLAKEICLVEEREKKRLATELHDSPMQKLALAQLQLASAAKHRDAESEQALAIGVDLLRDALQELRTLQFDLSPPVLYQEGLAVALRWLAAQTTQRLGVELSFEERGIPRPLGQELALILFQCVRELVHNLVKHAAASRGRMELEYLSDAVRVVVSDDGKGFAPDVPRLRSDAQSGYGLYSVRERLGLWGGRLAIDSSGAGTRATVEVPLGPAGDEACNGAERDPSMRTPDSREEGE
jgi:signal transduction histidine kinase